jgi:hypothetical protein
MQFEAEKTAAETHRQFGAVMKRGVANLSLWTMNPSWPDGGLPEGSPPERRAGAGRITGRRGSGEDRILLSSFFYG